MLLPAAVLGEMGPVALMSARRARKTAAPVVQVMSRVRVRGRERRGECGEYVLGDIGAGQAADGALRFSLVLGDEHVVVVLGVLRTESGAVVHAPQLVRGSFDLVRRAVDAHGSAVSEQS